MTLDRYTLEHAGRRLEVETEHAGLGNRARLFADGEQLDEGEETLEPVKLDGGEVTVVVKWDLRHRVTKCAVVPGEKDGEEIRFVPPEGSLLAKRERLERERPRLYASRHVAKATAGVLLGLLGVGALIKLLLPRIPLPSVDLPDIDPPSIPWPDLPLPDIDITLPGWVKAVLAAMKFIVPILIAVGVANKEVKKHRKKHSPSAGAQPSEPDVGRLEVGEGAARRLGRAGDRGSGE